MYEKYKYTMGKHGSFIIIDVKNNILIRDMYKATEILNEQNEEIQKARRLLYVAEKYINTYAPISTVEEFRKELEEI